MSVAYSRTYLLYKTMSILYLLYTHIYTYTHPLHDTQSARGECSRQNQRHLLPSTTTRFLCTSTSKEAQRQPTRSRHTAPP